MRKMEFVEELIKYDAPQVEIIEVEVEKGFAATETGGSGDDLNGGWQ